MPTASPSQVLGTVVKFHRVLEKHGVQPQHIQAVIDDPAFAERVAGFMKGESFRGLPTLLEISEGVEIWTFVDMLFGQPRPAAVEWLKGQNRLEQLLRTLSAREYNLVVMRYGLDGQGKRRFADIGQTFSITESRAAQIHSKVMAKLRHSSRWTEFNNTLLAMELSEAVQAKLESAGIYTVQALCGLSAEDLQGLGLTSDEVGEIVANLPQGRSLVTLDLSDRRLQMPIEELDLSVRAHNCLKREGINTLKDLVSRTKEDLLDIRNFGVPGVAEVERALKLHGLSLRPS